MHEHDAFVYSTRASFRVGFVTTPPTFNADNDLTAAALSPHPRRHATSFPITHQHVHRHLMHALPNTPGSSGASPTGTRLPPQPRPLGLGTLTVPLPLGLGFLHLPLPLDSALSKSLSN
ncbi:hypothetical protein Adt_23233 [Abeliophyllum distichum]|uniref:Uncharacterized protein n=1 Tax=Abeliophyllum distichum TaxID=126358 RepID=A0ABD1SBE3_9LAMI